MDSIYISLFLEYLYKKFAVTFILCLIGAFLKQSTLNSKKANKIKLGSLFSPTIFSTVLMCAIIDYVDMNFSVYAVVCVLVGMWSSILLKLFLDTKFIKKLVAIVLKKISGPLSEYSDELIEEIEEEQKEEDKEKDESSQQDSSSNVNKDDDS